MVLLSEVIRYSEERVGPCSVKAFGKGDQSCSEKAVGVFRKRRSALFGKGGGSFSEKTIGLVRKRRSVLFGKDGRCCSEKTIGVVRKRRSVSIEN